VKSPRVVKIPRAPRCIALILCVTSGLGAAAAATDRDDVERLPFSHVVHRDTDDTLACSDCHDATHTSAATGKPTLKRTQCEQCHDEIPAILSRVPSAALAFPVDHRPHAAVACASCHARVDGPDDEARRAPEHRLVVTAADCLSCHAKRSAAGAASRAPREPACITCHGRNERRERPASHASAGSSAWRRSHGSASSSAMGGAPLSQLGANAKHGTSCTLCHRESSCRTCHRVEAPRDHGGVWSERTHGVVASFDAQRCKTCHEVSACVGCHRATEPRNHTASWRATHGLVARTKSDTSCATCHRASFCVDCHRGAR
jgi:hypothetical protein